jgi:hypothetical protein
MGHKERAVWARSLVGRETAGGRLVLRGRRPLRLGAEHDGDVQLQLGDLSPRRDGMRWRRLDSTRKPGLPGEEGKRIAHAERHPR